MIKSVLTRHQKRNEYKEISAIDRTGISVELGYDDEYKNGHNTFRITGTITEKGKMITCGCIHDQIALYFPEFAKYIKWHLCSSDGPMHYISNTLYHALDKDCYGRIKGEPASFDDYIYFNGFNIGFKLINRKFRLFLKDNINKLNTTSGLKIRAISHEREKDGYVFEDKYTITPNVSEWYECEFDTKREAEEWLKQLTTTNWEIVSIPTSFSKGKNTELEAARACAIAPNATLEQLQDKKWLEDRLPSLLEEFKKDMEELGFVY